MFDRRNRLALTRLAKKRRKRFLNQVLFYSISGLVLLTILVMLMRRDAMQIETILVRGNSFISSSQISETTKQELAGNYFFVIPKSNVLFYPRSDIKAVLLESFKRIKDVSVGIISPKSIQVSIIERQAFALWCRIDKTISTEAGLVSYRDEACYFLDQEGMIFAEAPVASGDAYIEYYGGLAAASSTAAAAASPLGDKFLDPDRFKEISYFIKSLASYSIKAEKFTVNKDGDYEVTLDSNARLILDPKRDFADSLANLGSLLNDPDLKSQPFDFLSTVDYVDLRFGNKIYYRLR